VTVCTNKAHWHRHLLAPSLPGACQNGAGTRKNAPPGVPKVGAINLNVFPTKISQFFQTPKLAGRGARLGRPRRRISADGLSALAWGPCNAGRPRVEARTMRFSDDVPERKSRADASVPLKVLALVVGVRRPSAHAPAHAANRTRRLEQSRRVGGGRCPRDENHGPAANAPRCHSNRTARFQRSEACGPVQAVLPLLSRPVAASRSSTLSNGRCFFSRLRPPPEKDRPPPVPTMSNSHDPGLTPETQLQELQKLRHAGTLGPRPRMAYNHPGGNTDHSR